MGEIQLDVLQGQWYFTDRSVGYNTWWSVLPALCFYWG
jgi:hypothetical protein